MKYIYLDQNKWIELAKGIKENDEKYISLYKFIMNRVQEGSWAFPLSLIHIQETMKRKKETSRNEILDLMFSISREYTICDYMTADTLEFYAWTMNKTVDCQQLQSLIIQQNWANIIGLSVKEGKGQILYKYFCSREIFDLICKIINNGIEEDQKFYYQSYQEGRESFNLWKKQIQQLKEYSDKHLYPAYLCHVFFAVYKEQLANLDLISKVNMRQLFESNSKNKTAMIANLETLPGFNIHNRLVFELYNNPHRQVDPHDFNDLAYLRVAIHYCDIVICEKYWCDRVKNYKFDEKYHTEIRTRLLDLSTF